jgi:hypothetical protein
MLASFGEFKRDRAIEFDKLIQKYKNRTKEMDNLMKLEISNFPKSMKGLTRIP